MGAQSGLGRIGIGVAGCRAAAVKAVFVVCAPRGFYRRGGSTGQLGMGSGGRAFTGGGAADALAAAQESALRDAHQELSSSQRRRLAPYEFACLELSERLTPDEEDRLRATGELPDWFVPELKVRAAEIRKRRS
jgi:hypothetical protein